MRRTDLQADPTFLRLDQRYRAPLMAFFMRRIGSRAEAEDLTQEVFLRLARRDGAPSEDIPDSFIFTIAANLLRDRARRAVARSVNSHLRLDEPMLASDPGLIEDLQPERVLLSREALSRVQRALNELPPRTRDIFVLYRLEGMRQREIAQLFGISVSAVEKQIVRAIKRLGQEFAS